MEKRRAFITGAAGQDGTYLSDYLISKGYEVWAVDAPGTVPRSRVEHFRAIDICDADVFAAFLREARPHECYHLAAFHRSSASHVASTDEGADERASIETNLLSAHTILRTLHESKPECRVFFAASCHMFGDATEIPQTERTLFAPTNIYGVTKVAATLLGRFYREQEGMFVCTGILYNHESPLRGPDFVTARIAQAAARIKYGSTEKLTLGNLDAQVDWGFAGDYVQAMHAMLQAEKPEDFIIASGELHRVRDFAEIAFRHVGLDWTAYVQEDPSVHAPVSRAVYQGNASAIKERLGWKPTTSFKELVEMMVDRSVVGGQR
jgi:GDPmannose 4,6-dehydratase